jgi:CDP-diacylglycerol--glycerol-3-phosphate 3-phosphatidyltransferase
VTIVTTATRITIARFFFVPPLVVAVAGAVWWPAHATTMRAAALAVFVVGSLTDFLDGYVARRFDQRSRVGAALDPLADKLLLGAAIWSLWACQGAYGAVPVWYPVIVTLNDAVLGLGYMAVRRRIDPNELRAMIWGKVATTCQMVVVVWVLLKLPATLALVVASGAVTAASGAAYIVRALRLMNRTVLRTRDLEA